MANADIRSLIATNGENDASAMATYTPSPLVSAALGGNDEKTPFAEEDAPTMASPGGYVLEQDPYRRQENRLQISGPPGFAQNDATRARHYDERQARITVQQRDRRDALSTLNAHNKATSQEPLPANADSGEVERDTQREVLMAQTPEKQAANIARVGGLYDTEARRVAAGRQAGYDRAKAAAAEFKAKKDAGMHGPYVRQPSTAERINPINAELQKQHPGDFIHVKEHNPTGPGQVSEDGGNTWEPIKLATDSLEAANERTARPARMAQVESDAYTGAIRSGQAKTFDEAQQIGAKAVRDYAPLDAPMGPPSAAVHDPYHGNRKVVAATVARPRVAVNDVTYRRPKSPSGVRLA